MTMLYRLDAPAAQIARTFAARSGDDPWAGGYVAPGQFAPIITAGREFVAGARMERGPRRMVPRLWGVPPPPSATDPGRAITSVRNTDSPFWIGNLRNSEFRCLVPATGFFEWGAGVDVEGRRERFRITCPDAPILAFAGVWKDSEVPSFAIVTCPANAVLKSLGRERMPVIVPPTSTAQDTWLHAGWDRAQVLVAALPAGATHAELLDPFA
ncbi:MAG TPA: SOS response-associated peptidase family protein [Paracoccaceae bacterium]|nr:SOS response-associated peptidase family protein [Paracoccaceae bacterium]